MADLLRHAQLDKVPSAMRLVSERSMIFAAAEKGDDESGKKKKKRKFAMSPAYSGGAVRTWFGRMVVDLEGMEVPEGSMPILSDHDPSLRAGVATKLEKGDSLDVEGDLLDNETANGIARDADAGFPFQASIGFDIFRREWIDDGDAKEVNGQEFVGPGIVITKSALRETSVVTLGADSNTDSKIFGRAQPWPNRDTDTEDEMDAKAFAAKYPEVVEAWKREGADAARTELGSMLEALPALPAFVAEQFAAGSSVESIKVAAKLHADLTASQEGENDEIAKLKADAAKKAAEILKLKQQNGVDFTGAEDGELDDAAKKPASQLNYVEAKQRWESDAKLRAEFGQRESAWLKHVERAKKAS
jgi:hypothetical protein